MHTKSVYLHVCQSLIYYNRKPRGVMNDIPTCTLYKYMCIFMYEILRYPCRDYQNIKDALGSYFYDGDDNRRL